MVPIVPPRVSTHCHKFSFVFHLLPSVPPVLSHLFYTCALLCVPGGRGGPPPRGGPAGGGSGLGAARGAGPGLGLGLGPAVGMCWVEVAHPLKRPRQGVLPVTSSIARGGTDTDRWTVVYNVATDASRPTSSRPMRWFLRWHPYETYSASPGMQEALSGTSLYDCLIWCADSWLFRPRADLSRDRWIQSPES